MTKVEVTIYRERQTVSTNWNKIMTGGDKGSEGRKVGTGMGGEDQEGLS